MNTGALLEHFREDGKVGRYLAILAAEPLDLEAGLSGHEQGLEREFRDCLRRIEEQSRKRAEDGRVKELAAKGVAHLSEEERKEYARLTSRAPRQAPDGGA